LQPWVYIVLLGVCAIAYGLKLPTHSRGGSTEKRSLKETEAALELYVADIERENEEMVKLVSGIKQQSQVSHSALQEQLNELKVQLAEQQQKSAHIEARVAAGETGMLQLAFSHKKEGAEIKDKGNEMLPNPIPPVKPEPEPVNSIKMRYPKLFELNEQGKSIDAIAKLSGLQRGEVQLILQLAKQEESM